MKRTLLIRLGGLAAMVGGLLYTLGVLGCLLMQQVRVGPWSGFIIALVLGAMAATAALHSLQRERYGLPGALASLASFVGSALILLGHQVVFGSVTWPTFTPLLTTIFL